MKILREYLFCMIILILFLLKIGFAETITSFQDAKTLEPFTSSITLGIFEYAQPNLRYLYYSFDLRTGIFKYFDIGAKIEYLLGGVAELSGKLQLFNNSYMNVACEAGYGTSFLSVLSDNKFYLTGFLINGKYKKFILYYNYRYYKKTTFTEKWKDIFEDLHDEIINKYRRYNIGLKYKLFKKCNLTFEITNFSTGFKEPFYNFALEFRE